MDCSPHGADTSLLQFCPAVWGQLLLEGTAEGIAESVGRCPTELNLSLALGDLVDCQCKLRIPISLEDLVALDSLLFILKVQVFLLISFKPGHVFFFLNMNHRDDFTCTKWSAVACNKLCVNVLIFYRFI